MKYSLSRPWKLLAIRFELLLECYRFKFKWVFLKTDDWLEFVSCWYKYCEFCVGIDYA